MRAEPGPAALPPSGRQFHLENGAGRATVTEVGAGLRSFSVDGTPVLFGYDEDELCHGGKGQVLSPWPNRLEDGRYTFEGVSAVAALDEPEHGNAIHGLVRWLRFEPQREEQGGVTLVSEVMAQPAYPWRLRLEVTYELVSETCLSVSARASSSSRAPFGIGFHPYVHAGAGGVDRCELTFEAATHLLLDARGLPTGAEPVAGGPHDFSGGASLEHRRLDDCYGGLRGDEDGWSASLRRADGSAVALRADGSFAYLMCFTGDTLAAGERRRGLALEPMTCPPNALRSGRDLVVLDEGRDWEGSFSIELVEAPTRR